MHPRLVTLKCNNNNDVITWKKVQFNQTAVSLDANTDNINENISSVSETGKFICYNKNTVFQISYIYPQGILSSI